jgi:hypothetical protein
MEIETTEVTASTRQLKVTWSLEAQQDLEACHNINVTQVLADIIAREILEETDRELTEIDLQRRNSQSWIPGRVPWFAGQGMFRHEEEKVNWKQEGF